MKIKLYKIINKRIRNLTPAEYYKFFNIGISTGRYDKDYQYTRIENDKYRHWCYTSKDSENV
jgi:hypothetical protein